MPNELILLVDDEPHIIELAALYLKQDGFQVISAGDGLAALERVEQDQPALMVLDLMLPELDGWEVCKRVRAGSNLPILMLTARDDDIDKIVGLELGADRLSDQTVQSAGVSSACQGDPAPDRATPRRRRRRSAARRESHGGPGPTCGNGRYGSQLICAPKSLICCWRCWKMSK